MDTPNTFPAGQKAQVVRLTAETIDGDGEVVTGTLDLEDAMKKIAELDANKNHDELHMLRMA